MSDEIEDRTTAAYQNHLAAAVGHCLHAWSLVEVEVSHLFMIMHERGWKEFNHPLRSAFEAVVSFEARLSMIKATAFSDPVLENYAPHFPPLSTKLTKEYQKRPSGRTLHVRWARKLQ